MLIYANKGAADGHTRKAGLAFHARAGRQQNFIYEYYDEPYLFNLEMQKSAFAWMDKYLRADLERG